MRAGKLVATSVCMLDDRTRAFLVLYLRSVLRWHTNYAVKRREDDRRSAVKEISLLVWNPKFHDLVLKILKLDPVPD